MNTALKTDEEKKEYFDTPEELDKKITTLAEWIKSSKHFIAFTGAGISTAAGIPDFRSGVNTVLPTGPGCWEKAAKNLPSKGPFRGNMNSAVPTMCHMALVRLQEAGYLKFLISQNTDGLHRKSGFPCDKIAELHGNSNLEICKNSSCGKQFLRDFRTRTAKEVHDHQTGRRCENCGSELYDSIINFGESLPEKELKNGYANSRKADLCLALGSSLRVTPAADLPLETVENKGKLVIVNLQATPLDDHALRINSFIDDVLTRLMEKLGLDIPPFILKRRVVIMKTDKDSSGKQTEPGIYIRGIDEAGTPYTLFTEVKTTFCESKEAITLRDKEPYLIYPKKSDLDNGLIKITLNFQGHYGEPPLDLELPLESLKFNKPVYYLLEFDPSLKKWINYSQTVINKI